MSGDIAAPAGGAPAAGSTDTSTSSTSSTSTPAAAEATGPRTSAQIAANVIERDANPQEPESDEGTMTAAEIAAVERFSEEEKLLREQGFKRAKRADGSEHTIPRSKVLSIINNGLKRGREQFATEKAALEKETQELRTFRDGFATQLRGDERQFLAYIAQHDPRYKRFLDEQAPARAAEPAHAVSDEPQPDLDLGNGAKTYSKEQLQKWVQWSLEQHLAPMHQEREEAKKREAEQQAQHEQRERVRGVIEDAKGWANWTDYEGDVLKKLQADTAAARARGQRPQMSLREAYLEVRAERLEAATDPAKVRERVIADMNAAPRSTSVRTTTEVPRVAGLRSTADIARGIIERTEGKR